MNSQSVDTRCLVIGSGIAGLSAALALAEKGHKTLLITAAPEAAETNTVYAQGGIVLDATQGRSLVQDILGAGCGVNYLPAVEQLADLGPGLVRSVLIEQAGVQFDSREGDEWDFTREGGHSSSRIVHCADETGKSIEQALLARVRASDCVEVRTHQTAVNLLMTSHHNVSRGELYGPARCFGAFVFDDRSGQVYPIFSDHTVLATGGVGQLFLHNTNSRFARGDGIALADRAGCRLQDLEYIQFHPTTFFQPGAPRFLISEALRGEGGVLVTASGERFLDKYIAGVEIPELAPRDRVSQAIHQQMLSSQSTCVYLDISHKEPAWIKSRFPFVYKTCLRYGVDITHDPIPVVPGAHYSCGGVWVDLQGRTTIPGLWAVGEVACSGLHGANRLASTSLLEGLVWGTLAGRAISDILPAERPRFPRIAPWELGKRRVDPAFLSQDWLTLKHTMWNYVGLMKTESRLRRAQGILTELARGIATFYQQAELSDPLIGLRHGSWTALRILEASMSNPRSLGCYQRAEGEL